MGMRYSLMVLINIDKEVAEELAMFRGECLGLYGVGIIDEEVMRNTGAMARQETKYL